MADNWAQSVTCRYYKNGLCREGDNCRYRHTAASENDDNDDIESNVLNDSINGVSAVIACRFFKWGSCKFGNRCRFDHGSNNDSTMLEMDNHHQQQHQQLQKKRIAEDEHDEEGDDEAEDDDDDCDDDDEDDDQQHHKDESRTAASTSSIAIPHTSTSTPSSSTYTSTTNDPIKADDWVNAPEFVPYSAVDTSTNSDIDMESSSVTYKPPESYARAVNSNGQSSNPASEPLCPYAEANGVCRRLECSYLHGDICDMCGRAALHPYNKELHQKHISACVKQHEADMELSFAIQRSRDKSCGICFEIVMEKTTREQRFGILPNCNHCFCLSCIRKWRLAKQFDNKIIRSCPECRVASDFVCPSAFWVDTKEEKDKLIVEYKGALSQKDCKYFKKGQGKCPFGNKCFYLHALPDGTKTDVGPPARQENVNIEFLQQLILWNFLEERDNRWIYVGDHEELVVLFSDSNDSDW